VDAEQIARDAARAGFTAEPRSRSGTYTSPSGDDPVDSLFLVERGVDLLPDAVQPFYTQKVTTVSMLTEDIPDPRPGGTITIGAVDYVLDAQLDHDGYVVRMQVR